MSSVATGACRQERILRQTDQLRQGEAGEYGAGEEWIFIDGAAAQHALEQKKRAGDCERDEQRYSHGLLPASMLSRVSINRRP